MTETVTVHASDKTYSLAKIAAITICKRMMGDGSNVAVAEDAHPGMKCWRLDSCHGKLVSRAPYAHVEVEATFSFRASRESGDPGEIAH